MDETNEKKVLDGLLNKQQQEQEKDGTIFCKSFVRQLFAISGTLISTISFGMTTGFVGTLSPQLKKDPSFKIDNNIESWIACSCIVGMPIGILLSILFVNYCGKRLTQIITCVLWIHGWIIIASATSVWLIMLGCLLTSVSAGMSSSVANVYSAEISEPKYRGLLSAMIAAKVALGILLGHLAGIIFPWRIAMAVSASLPLISVILLIFAPETPTWLVMNGYTDLARKQLKWLRNNSANWEEEFKMLQERNCSNTKLQSRGILMNIKSSMFLKPFSILSVLFLVQQGSGITVIIVYTIRLMERISGNVDPNKCTITVDIVRVISSVAACYFTKKFKRRHLFLASATLSVTSLMGLIVMLSFDSSNFIAIVGFVGAYVFFTTAGLVPVPWLMASELFPTPVRQVGSSITNCYAILVMFFIVKTGLHLIVISVTATFSIYIVIVVSGSVIAYFYMPETKLQSLHEVEDALTKK